MSKPRLETRLTPAVRQALDNMKFGDTGAVAARFGMHRSTVIKLRRLLKLPQLKRPPTGSTYYQERTRKDYDPRIPKKEGTTIQVRGAYLTQQDVDKLTRYVDRSQLRLQALWVQARTGTPEQQVQARKILKQEFRLEAPPLPGDAQSGK